MSHVGKERCPGGLAEVGPSAGGREALPQHGSREPVGGAPRRLPRGGTGKPLDEPRSLIFTLKLLVCFATLRAPLNSGSLGLRVLMARAVWRFGFGLS